MESLYRRHFHYQVTCEGKQEKLEREREQEPTSGKHAWWQMAGLSQEGQAQDHTLLLLGIRGREVGGI